MTTSIKKNVTSQQTPSQHTGNWRNTRIRLWLLPYFFEFYPIFVVVVFVGWLTVFAIWRLCVSCALLQYFFSNTRTKRFRNRTKAKVEGGSRKGHVSMPVLRGHPREWPSSSCTVYYLSCCIHLATWTRNGIACYPAPKKWPSEQYSFAVRHRVIRACMEIGTRSRKENTGLLTSPMT